MGLLDIVRFCSDQHTDLEKLEKIQTARDQDLSALVEKFPDFHISEENIRYKIAEFIASKNGRLISYQIPLFDLEPLHKRDIAILALKQDARGTLEHLNNYHLDEDATYLCGGNHEKTDAVLPMVHLVFSNLKTWLLGTHHGVSVQHLAAYLNEFTFRFNRRFYPMIAVGSVLGIMTSTPGQTYSELYEKKRHVCG